MGNQGLKYAALAAVTLAIILGILAYRMTLSMTSAAREEASRAAQASQQEANAQPTTLAVVALRPLAATQVIEPDDIGLMPISVLPTRYFSRLEDVLGRAPLIDVDAGAPVTPRYFRDSNVLARLIPAGHQAMSVEISDVVAVGGFIRPGDEVDLLLFIRGTSGPAQSRVLLEKVLVLAYEDRIIERPEGLRKEEGRPERRSRVRTAVLAIPEKSTTKVMLGASVGEVRLALHRQFLASEDAAGNAGGSPLPAASSPAGTKPAAADDFSREKAITLTELTRLAAKKSSRPKPRPYVIQVLRGGTSQTVTD